MRCNPSSTGGGGTFAGDSGGSGFEAARRPRRAPSDALAVDPGQTSSTPRDDIMFVEECLARLSVRVLLRTRPRANPTSVEP